MLVAASLLLLAGLLLVSAIEVVQATWFAVIIERVPQLLVLEGWLFKSASTVIFIVLVGLVFYFVPNASVRFRDVWVGAVLTGLLWRGALAGFSRYVRDLHRFSVHGSIAAVVAFLVWVYISAVILLYGVEVTAAYARLRRRRPEEIPPAPAPRTTLESGQKHSSVQGRTGRSKDSPCASWQATLVSWVAPAEHQSGEPGRRSDLTSILRATGMPA
jgi:uncharacterized BrkB/YihY/UPF0761 family membrane protein